MQQQIPQVFLYCYTGTEEAFDAEKIQLHQALKTET